MIQLASGQLLQVALWMCAVTLFAVAVIFALVVYATGNRRAGGWIVGWACAALTVAIGAASITVSEQQELLTLAATLMGFLTAVTLGAAAYRFSSNRAIPEPSLALLGAGGIVAIIVWWRTHVALPLLGPEIGLCVGVLMNSLGLLPLCGDRRRGGARASAVMSLIIALMLGRTLVASIMLWQQHAALNELYWAIEALIGTIASFVLALTEVVATLDEMRIELLSSNESLNRAMQGLQTAAKIDPLTGLNNRYAFYQLIDTFSAQHATGCIAILDLNNLKKINDTFGHQAGDDALLSVSRRLREVIRSSDHVFRWGGDEFVVVLQNTTVETARERLARMQPPDAIYAGAAHKQIDLAVSWGVAQLRQNVDASLREADEQLYAQKRLVKRATGELATQ